MSHVILTEMKTVRINYYFIFSILLIIILKCVEYPSQTYHAEIWAETGNNFLQNAVGKNVWQNIWTPDAGYLPWFQRSIAVFVVQGLHLIKEYALAVQLVSVFFIALFSICSTFS